MWIIKPFHNIPQQRISMTMGGLIKKRLLHLLRIINHINKSDPEDTIVLSPDLPLPKGIPEDRLFDFIRTVRVVDGPPDELTSYCESDFRRFVYTFGLINNVKGRALELGANPYFTTMLLHTFTDLELTLANYFNSNHPDHGSQEVSYSDFYSGKQLSMDLEYDHFNVENEQFPYPDNTFDAVLFCEIIEHLTNDPINAIREMKRVLKHNGILVLTTPNVSRLENVARMVAGVNIYDPYSGYGPYGRHNREYNKHELAMLLDYMGFDIEVMFTADVHINRANDYYDLREIHPLVKERINDLGQYIFIRAINVRTAGNKKPGFLYRSLPGDLIEEDL